MLAVIDTLFLRAPAGMKSTCGPTVMLPPSGPITSVSDWSGRAEQGTRLVAWRGLRGRSIEPTRDALSAAGGGGSVGERSHADPTDSTASAITKRRTAVSRIAVVPDSPGDGIVREMAQLAGDELCRRGVR